MNILRIRLLDSKFISRSICFYLLEDACTPNMSQSASVLYHICSILYQYTVPLRYIPHIVIGLLIDTAPPKHGLKHLFTIMAKFLRSIDFTTGTERNTSSLCPRPCRPCRPPSRPSGPSGWLCSCSESFTLQCPAFADWRNSHLFDRPKTKACGLEDEHAFGGMWTGLWTG